MSRPHSISPPTRAGSTSASPTTPTTSRKRRRGEQWSTARRGESSQSSPRTYNREDSNDEGRLDAAWEGRAYEHRTDALLPEVDVGEGREGWTYHLEVIQQPQRARACGFGNKDRRPLSPPPIIRLWIRTASGAIVDPNLVDTRFLIMMVDLWSADRQQERNVVMHPVSAGVSRLDSPPLAQLDLTGAGPSSRPSTGNSRPLTGSSGGVSSWSVASYRQPAYSSPVPPSGSRVALESPSAHQVVINDPPPQSSPVHPSPRTGWAASRPPIPSFNRTQSYTKPQIEHVPDPPRPKTAPSQAAQSSSPPSPSRPDTGSTAYNLPSLASIAEDRPITSSGLTLPALHSRTQPFRPSSSGSSVFGRPRTSHSLAEDRGMLPGDFSFSGRPISSSSSLIGSTEHGGRERPSSSWSDIRPWSSGVNSNRPSSSGEELRSPRSSQAGYAVRMADPLYPPTPGTGPAGVSFSQPDIYPSSAWETEKAARYLASQPAAQYSRVLVGKVTAVCHKLQDDNDQPGLYFFAADLGIRTEGTFTLRMVMTDIGSMMGPEIFTGTKAPILCQIYTNPFTVYSAKRFPGVIPTTAMTKVFAAQGVKLSVRETKKAGGGGGEEGDGDGDDDDD